MNIETWDRLNPGMPMPPGLREPWRWVQPADTETLLLRLREARDLRVHERERENLCAVAHAKILELLAERVK